VWQGGVAGVVAAVADALGPLAFHCLVEALDLAVPARRVGRRDDLADVVLGEEVMERAVAGVAPGPSVITRRVWIPWPANQASARSKNAVVVAARSSSSSSP